MVTHNHVISCSDFQLFGQLPSQCFFWSTKKPAISSGDYLPMFFAQPIPTGRTDRHQVFKLGFWMKKFRHATLKHTTVVSNTRGIHLFDLGKLTAEEKKCEYATVDTYIDASGKKRWKGSKQLKQTQSPSCAKVSQCFTGIMCIIYIVWRINSEHLCKNTIVSQKGGRKIGNLKANTLVGMLVKASWGYTLQHLRELLFKYSLNYRKKKTDLKRMSLWLN